MMAVEGRRRGGGEKVAAGGVEVRREVRLEASTEPFYVFKVKFGLPLVSSKQDRTEVGRVNQGQMG